ncbi:MAG: MgtC/SapB family protein [Candidatus Diapherotrites archaeon]|nr:MgtC/SapB family protein [Candidatus Diapherotrites archaeon]
MVEITELISSWTAIEPVLISLAIGALIGMEREHTKQQEVVGVRTFALVSLMGALFVSFGNMAGMPELVGAGFIAVTLLSFVLYAGSIWKYKAVGLTTSIALLLSYVMGVFAGYGRYTEAVFITIAVTIVLFAKTRLHALVDKLSDKEVLDLLEFLALIGIIYPLLPTKALVYLDVVIDFQLIWMLAVLISIINLMGFIGSRFLPRVRQLELMALLGGIISSTAISYNLSLALAKNKERESVLANAYYIINGAMILRNMAIISIIAPAALSYVTIPSVVSAGILLLFGFRGLGREKKPAKLRMESPFAVTNAVGFVLKLLVVIFLLQAILVYLPSIFFLAVLVGGIASSASTMASIASSVALQQISVETAAIATCVVAMGHMLIGNMAVYRLAGAWKAAKRAMLVTVVSAAAFIVLLVASMAAL